MTLLRRPRSPTLQPREAGLRRRAHEVGADIATSIASVLEAETEETATATAQAPAATLPGMLKPPALDTASPPPWPPTETTENVTGRGAVAEAMVGTPEKGMAVVGRRCPTTNAATAFPHPDRPSRRVA